MFSLYIHIPFCKQKCAYCAFYSKADLQQRESYFKALQKAIRQGERRPLSTLYFGGGTPALLGGEQIAALIGEAKAHFGLLPDAEITIELNPESTTLPLLETLRAAGVNRISLGVQSLNDGELQTLGRLHNAQKAKEALELIFRAGFQNVSADVMFGIPNQTKQTFGQTLDTLLSFPLTHLSCYSLQWEQGTPLGAHPQPMEEDLEEALWLLLCQKAKKQGFSHYEISNFAKKGFESRHNSAYWARTDYLGLGPSAHSFIHGVRYSAEEDLAAFIANPDPLQNPLPIEEQEAKEEQIMLGLRTNRGIPLSLLPPDFNFEKYKDFAFIQGDRWILNERGYFLSNSIIQGVIQ